MGEKFTDAEQRITVPRQVGRRSIVELAMMLPSIGTGRPMPAYKIVVPT